MRRSLLLPNKVLSKTSGMKIAMCGRFRKNPIVVFRKRSGTSAMGMKGLTRRRKSTAGEATLAKWRTKLWRRVGPADESRKKRKPKKTVRAGRVASRNLGRINWAAQRSRNWSVIFNRRWKYQSRNCPAIGTIDCDGQITHSPHLREAGGQKPDRGCCKSTSVGDYKNRITHSCCAKPINQSSIKLLIVSFIFGIFYTIGNIPIVQACVGQQV